MSFLTESQAARLRAGALSAIWHSHSESFRLSPRAQAYPHGKPPEEDFVALLIIDGLPRLMKAWRPFFSKWKIQISLTGVFCHQTPKAEFSQGSKMSSPELADLLLVRRHTDTGGNTRQVASLLQAKMSDNGDLSLPNGDPQLFLMTHWPLFRLKGKNAPVKDFAVGRAERQAVYAAISGQRHYPEQNVEWPDGCAWGTLLPSQKASAEKSLASFLVDMLNFDEGREFYDRGTTGCDWSELICYLLTETLNMPLRTRDMVPSAQRGITVGLNRAAVVEKEGRFKPEYLPKNLISLGDDFQLPPDQGTQFEFLEGGQGRAIILETSAVQG